MHACMLLLLVISGDYVLGVRSCPLKIEHYIRRPNLCYCINKLGRLPNLK